MKPDELRASARVMTRPRKRETLYEKISGQEVPVVVGAGALVDKGMEQTTCTAISMARNQQMLAIAHWADRKQGG